MAIFIDWPDETGIKHTFETHPFDTEFLPNPGVYIASIVGAQSGKWTALYVGEAKSFYQRVNADFPDNHDGLKRAARAGATHIGVLRVDNSSERLLLETSLRHSLNPLCNRQPVPDKTFLTR